MPRRTPTNHPARATAPLLRLLLALVTGALLSLAAGALLSLAAGALLSLAAGALHQPAAQPAAPPERLPGTPPPEEIIQREPLAVAQLLQGQRDVIRVTVSDGGISPATLRGQVGKELHLHLSNGGRREHNFLVPAFGIVTQPTPPGGETYVAFTPSRPGTFPFFSGDPRSHTPEPGLEGSLVVSP